ncbi:prolyl oligopeptidase family serine peptidase [Sphingopyxis sp. 550A]
MRKSLQTGLPAAALLAVAALSPVALAGESKGRPWTLDDILTVPEVKDVALSEDGKLAIYAVEIADLAADKPQSHIRILDIAAARQRTIVTVDNAKSLRRIPRTADWSALLDLGAGLQLYRITSGGMAQPLIVNPATVPVGKADMSFPIGGGVRPSSVGVLDYDWSPDGAWLWYSQLRALPNAPRVRFDAEVSALQSQRRSTIDVEIDYFLRGPDGKTDLMLSRPSKDRMATRGGGQILWRGDEVQFRVETPDGSEGGRFEMRAWNRLSGTMRTLGVEHNLETVALLRGPRGGDLATSGLAKRLDLVETGPDGKRNSYGAVAFTIGDPRAPAYEASRDGKKLVIGTRDLEAARYGLAIVTRDGVRRVESEHSLTRCAYDDALLFAVCVEEGIATPPRLVKIDLGDGRISRLLPISAEHEAIAPLTILPRVWTNRDGYEARGFVVLPRGYQKGKRYPAVIITHGSDADDRFAAPGFQWNYPLQLLAERGYMVLLINDPSPLQSEEMMAASKAWIRGSGPPDPETLQRLLWIEGVHIFEDAVDEMAIEDLVDRDRVGIAGYSRGSQMVNVAVTQSTLFRAASSGDGGYLEPAGYATAGSSYDAVYGGAPLSDAVDSYRRFAPSLNASRVCAAVLQQVASASPSQIELFEALRAAKAPTQISHYPGATAASDETHVFYRPSNRSLAMQENIAWFDYWLLGRDDVDAPFPKQTEGWPKLKRERPDRCRAANGPGQEPLHQRTQFSAAANSRIR